MLEKLRNKIPVLFQRPLFDKMIHEYRGQKYWELPHVSGPLLCMLLPIFMKTCL